MTANVSVLIEHKEAVLKIPNAALRFRPAIAKIKETGEKGQGGPPQKPRSGEQVKTPQGEKERPGKVWVLSPQGKPTPVSIFLGITDGTFSEVVSGDLREGVEVIVEEAESNKS